MGLHADAGVGPVEVGVSLERHEGLPPTLGLSVEARRSWAGFDPGCHHRGGRWSLHLACADARELDGRVANASASDGEAARGWRSSGPPCRWRRSARVRRSSRRSWRRTAPGAAVGVRDELKARLGELERQLEQARAGISHAAGRAGHLGRPGPPGRRARAHRGPRSPGGAATEAHRARRHPGGLRAAAGRGGRRSLTRAPKATWTKPRPNARASKKACRKRRSGARSLEAGQGQRRGGRADRLFGELGEIQAPGASLQQSVDALTAELGDAALRQRTARGAAPAGDRSRRRRPRLTAWAHSEGDQRACGGDAAGLQAELPERFRAEVLESSPRRPPASGRPPAASRWRR